MKTLLIKPRVSTLARWLAGLLLVFAALLWWLIVSDVYTSMRYSSSYAVLSSSETTSAFYISVGACVLAAGLAFFSAVRAPAKRLRSCFLLVVSLGLVPAAWLYSRHVAYTTIDAVLDPRPSIRDTLLNP